MPTIAVIVVSLPERYHMLCEALGSVASQTRPPDDTVVGIDPRHWGECGNRNRLMDATDAEWFAFLDDDDLFHPEHLAVCEKLMSDDVDVIASRFNLVGRDRSTMESWHPDWNDLRHTNWFGPSMTCAKRSVFGHWVENYAGYRWGDWGNWNRMLDIGARWADTGVVTVDYRFLGGNASWPG